MLPTMPLISIVDDDLSVRRALRRLVRSAGYGVETFASRASFSTSPTVGALRRAWSSTSIWRG